MTKANMKQYKRFEQIDKFFSLSQVYDIETGVLPITRPQTAVGSKYHIVMLF